MKSPLDRRRILNALVAWPLRRPRRAWALALGLLVLAWVSLFRMELDSDIEGLVGTPSAQAYGRVSKIFGWRDQAYLLLETDVPQQADALVRCAQQIERELESQPGVVRRVTYGSPGLAPRDDLDAQSVVLDLLSPFGLLLLEDPDMVARLLQPEGLAERAEESADLLSLPGLGDPDRFVAEDPLGLTKTLAARFQSLKSGYRFAPGSPWFVSEDGRALLCIVQGEAGGRGSSETMARLVLAIDQAVDTALAARHADDVEIRVLRTGGAYLADESRSTIQGDLMRGLSTSIALAIVFLAIGFRTSLWTVLLLCLPTLWGVTVGIGAFAWLSGGVVSALSFACAGILIGLGLDFTIHVTAAAFQARGFGYGAARALLTAFRETRGRLALAALTSATAFLAFTTSDAGFLRDMGVVTALGLAACLVSPFLVLPVILLPALARAKAQDTASSMAVRAMQPLVTLAQKPTVVVLGTLLPTAAAVAWLIWHPPTLEEDLRNVHAEDSVALAALDRMTAVFEGSFEPLLLLVDAEDERGLIEDTRALEAELKPLVEDGTLLSVQSIAGLIPTASSQSATLTLLQQHDPDQFVSSARTALDDAGFDVDEFGDYLAALRRSVAVSSPVTPRALRQLSPFKPMVDRFVGASGSPGAGVAGLVVLHPREELWSGPTRNTLLARVRAAVVSAGLGPGRVALTGMHPTAAESAEQVAFDFARVSLLTMLAVLVVLWLRFRRVAVVMMTLVPAVLGTLWTAVLFSVLGYQLNLMNLGVLPMVLALGVDDGIHLVGHAVAAARDRGDGRLDMRRILESTGTGILLTSVTTMVTFGSLGLSANRGLASVGMLSFVGIGCCLVASVAVLPALLLRFGIRSDAGGDPR